MFLDQEIRSQQGTAGGIKDIMQLKKIFKAHIKIFKTKHHSNTFRIRSTSPTIFENHHRKNILEKNMKDRAT